MWTCPECNRQFRNRNQAHSCVTISVDSHFEGKAPHVRQTFDALVERLQDIEPFYIHAVKSKVYLGRNSHFLAAIPMKDSLRISFATIEPLEHPGVEKSKKCGPSLYENYFRLHEEGDISSELVEMIRAAATRS